MEAILEAAKEAGATRAGFTVLRLPLEIKELFEEWLRQHRPDRAERVLSLIRQMRGGALYQAEFGLRMRGEGPIAQLLSARFAAAVKRLDLNRVRFRLDTMAFRVPEWARTALVDAKRDARQMKLLAKSGDRGPPGPLIHVVPESSLVNKRLKRRTSSPLAPA